MSRGRWTYSKASPEQEVTSVCLLVLTEHNVYSVSSEILLKHLGRETFLPQSFLLPSPLTSELQFVRRIVAELCLAYRAYPSLGKPSVNIKSRLLKAWVNAKIPLRKWGKKWDDGGTRAPSTGGRTLSCPVVSLATGALLQLQNVWSFSWEFTK